MLQQGHWPGHALLFYFLVSCLASNQGSKKNEQCKTCKGAMLQQGHWPGHALFFYFLVSCLAANVALVTVITLLTIIALLTSIAHLVGYSGHDHCCSILSTCSYLHSQA